MAVYEWPRRSQTIWIEPNANVSFSDTFVYVCEWAFTVHISVFLGIFKFLHIYCKDIIERCLLRCVVCHDLIISTFCQNFYLTLPTTGIISEIFVVGFIDTRSNKLKKTLLCFSSTSNHNRQLKCVFFFWI